jgi:hypothetical protein
MIRSILSFMLMTLLLIGHMVYAQKKESSNSYYGIMKGTIEGAYVSYHDNSSIKITPGYGECNGHYWEITEPIYASVAIISGPSSDDIRYFYINDSQSSFPTPTIYYSTTLPTWSDSKLGWYSGNDRCIGVFWYGERYTYPHTKFTVHGDGRLVRYITEEPIVICVNGDTPTGSWTMMIGEEYGWYPVNSTAVSISGYATDDGPVLLAVSAYENASPGKLCRELSCVGFNRASISGWVQLGASLDISWYGEADDDSAYIYLNGFEYQR